MQAIPANANQSSSTSRHPPKTVDAARQQLAHFDKGLHLRSGDVLRPFTLAYETYGRLNAARSNAILICHALSGDAHVARRQTSSSDEKPGWWDEAVGPGKIFDTDRFFVVCSNVIGGCKGSTGPSSLAPDGKPYALRFPLITIADMVQAQNHLIEHLGIKKLFAVVGGSMGGMQALQWAVDYPDQVGCVLFLASTPRTSAQQIAFNEAGRRAIYADPNWNEGNYYDGPAPDNGLSVARMVAHITYMSETSLERKFGRNLENPKTQPAMLAEPEFAVESYLIHQGQKFVQRFDANSYLYITKAIDYFDISADYGSLRTALERTTCDFLVVSFSSDWLYPAEQSQSMVRTLEELGRSVVYHHITAPFGHDSFLVEVEHMAGVAGVYLDKQQKKQRIQPPEMG